VRYPRGTGTGTGVAIAPALTALEIGKAEFKRQGKKIAILAFGTMVSPAVEAAEKLDATAINMRFIKPLDTQLISDIAASHDLIITIEENTHLGGAGSGVAEFLLSIGNTTPVEIMGLPDKFLNHGDHKTMLSACGLDAVGIISTVQKHFPV